MNWNQIKAADKLMRLSRAAESTTPITDVCHILNMDPELFDTPEDFANAIQVRIHDLMREAGA